MEKVIGCLEVETFFDLGIVWLVMVRFGMEGGVREGGVPL